jgi:hypothetical protein
MGSRVDQTWTEKEDAGRQKVPGTNCQKKEQKVPDTNGGTYWLLAARNARGVKVVMRNHYLRDDTPINSRRPGKGQCVTKWGRPVRPHWIGWLAGA